MKRAMRRLLAALLLAGSLAACSTSPSMDEATQSHQDQVDAGNAAMDYARDKACGRIVHTMVDAVADWDLHALARARKHYLEDWSGDCPVYLDITLEPSP